MEQATTLQSDPFFAALRELHGMRLLPSAVAEALLHLSFQAFDGLRASREPVPPLITVGDQSGYLAGDLVQYLDQEPTRRGPIKIRHVSFADFLIQGLPDDTWVFEMVTLDFHGMRRPVDLLTCLDLSQDQVAGANFHDMTLKEYIAVMDGYLSHFAGQRVAEELATERARLALHLTPSRVAPAGHQRPRNGREKSST
ncbi:MAG: hypothetical protein ACTHNE_15745 [Dyella sp.]|uniref:hypothetical protein n=1 Tax=Dyella sp. TaxID=1869338 RepID=UPI003F8146DC